MLSIVKQEFSLEDYVQLSKSKATLCLQTEKQEEKTQQTQTLTVSPLLLAKCSPFFDVLALSLKNEDILAEEALIAEPQVLPIPACYFELIRCLECQMSFLSPQQILVEFLFDTKKIMPENVFDLTLGAMATQIKIIEITCLNLMTSFLQKKQISPLRTYEFAKRIKDQSLIPTIIHMFQESPKEEFFTKDTSYEFLKDFIQHSRDLNHHNNNNHLQQKFVPGSIVTMSALNVNQEDICKHPQERTILSCVVSCTEETISLRPLITGDHLIKLDRKHCKIRRAPSNLFHERQDIKPFECKKLKGFKINDIPFVLAKDKKNQYFPATVQEQRDDQYYVSFCGYGPEYDEWIHETNILHSNSSEEWLKVMNFDHNIPDVEKFTDALLNKIY